MGAAEHLKTLCCLGLPPESAMIAVTPLLHEIIPHGWTGIALLEPDATMSSSTYGEHPGTVPLYRERLWKFADDPTSPLSLWLPGFRVVGIGWSLHLQGRGWLDSSWYREIEAPLDACWMLDAMIGDCGHSIAFVQLTRPRSARPFAVDDVQRLDRLRTWLAHAFRKSPPDGAQPVVQDSLRATDAPVATGQIILTADGKLVFQTPSLEYLLRRVLERESGSLTSYSPANDRLPVPIKKLFQQLLGTANGTSNTPPRMQIPTPYGVVTLEATWLIPANTNPADVARDPKGCLISVTIELREHALAHAARVLRESGATPAQMKIGIQLAMGKSKPAIADALGIELSSVASHAKKLYQTLDIHNSTELASKIWLNEKTGEAQRSALLISLANSAKTAKSSLIYRT